MANTGTPSTMPAKPNTDAATEVSHYEVHLLILASDAARIAARGCLGVERVEDRLALHERQTRIACTCHKLVYHYGVSHVGWAVAHLCDVVGKNRTEVAHMLVLGIYEVLLHRPLGREGVKNQIVNCISLIRRDR